MAYIFKDLNVRDPFVVGSNEAMAYDTLLYDTKVVVQSVWRLVTTQEGEIPNFRAYGLDIKQFVQYPLTEDTVDLVYNYVKNKVTAYEGRADIISADVNVDVLRGIISMSFILQVKSSGETVKLPVWHIQVGASI